MSDTIRAGKIIASAILVVGGFIAFQTYSGEEGDRGPGGLIALIGIVLLLENWLLLFSTIWRAIRTANQSEGDAGKTTAKK